MNKKDKVRVTLTIDIDLADSEKHHWANANDFFECECDEVSRRTIVSPLGKGGLKIGNRKGETSDGSKYTLSIEKINTDAIKNLPKSVKKAIERFKKENVKRASKKK